MLHLTIVFLLQVRALDSSSAAGWRSALIAALVQASCIGARNLISTAKGDDTNGMVPRSTVATVAAVGFRRRGNDRDGDSAAPFCSSNVPPALKKPALGVITTRGCPDGSSKAVDGSTVCATKLPVATERSRRCSTVISPDTHVSPFIPKAGKPSLPFSLETTDVKCQKMPDLLATQVSYI